MLIHRSHRVAACRWTVALTTLFLASCGCVSNRAGGVFRGDTNMPDMKARAQAEVVALHAFFQDWFNGDLSNTDDAFARFDGVVAPAFHMVSPGGQVMDRDTIIDRVRAGHASSQSTPDEAMKIWIENQHVRWLDAESVLVTYEEWQLVKGRTRGRISTALLRESPRKPNGLEWLHVHETWLPEK